jgi:hypothetical protein
MVESFFGKVIGVLMVAAPVGAVMYFKWNSDGPGTEGGGEDRGVKIEAPMAAPLQPTQPPQEQRRSERATISGTVRDGEGEPVAGAMVCAVADSTLVSANDIRQPHCARSGADGGYIIEDLFGVRQRVSAGAAGHLPADHVYMQAGVRRRAVDLRPGGEARDIDLALARGGVEVRGVVEDLRGEPIADAWVASGGPGSGTGIGWGRSAKDGTYTLWVRPGVVTVAVQAAGHVPGSATGPSEGHTFAVYLAPESVLRGKVFHADDREPIDGARVRARPGGEAVLTDAAGHFHFDGLPPGIYKPQVETDTGFGMAAEQVALGLGETSWPLMIAVKPAVFVEGRIVRADGSVCDDGAVTLREQASGRVAHDTTEPGGMVHVRGLLPGTYSVEVACTGAIAAERYPQVIVRDKEVREQVWQVAPGRAIAGVLVDASGAPVVGATLVARSLGGRHSPLAGVSDAQGGFLLRGLRPGRYEVVPVVHARRTMPDLPVMVEVGDADVAGLRVAVAATGEVRGTLRDRRGLAIAGAEVALRTTRGAQQVITGDDGGFRFATAAVGHSALAVSRGGAPLPVRAHPRVVVAVGEATTVELVTTAPMGAITGVLRDEQGAPAAGALVEARPTSATAEDGLPGLWRAGGERPQFTDAAGSFTLAGLGATTYTVAAHRVGGGEARREGVKPGAALTLVLVPGGRVTGTVALHGGGAPDSFVIDLLESGTGQRRRGEFIGTAGAWGFGGLAHGSYEVRVQAREGAHSGALEFRSGGERSGVRIELVGATTLRGRVLDLEGAPVPGLEVASRLVRGDESDAGTITDDAGRFELARLPVGSVSVTIGAPNGQASPFGSVRIAVDVQPDQHVIDLPPIRVARRRIAIGGARGDLGFTIVPGKAGADPMLADLQVDTVRFGGPAASAGLLPHDEIVAVDGQDVRGVNRSLYATMIEVPAGTTVRLGLARGATVDVVAGKRR